MGLPQRSLPCRSYRAALRSRRPIEKTGRRGSPAEMRPMMSRLPVNLERFSQERASRWLPEALARLDRLTLRQFLQEGLRIGSQGRDELSRQQRNE
jgi:hypothetical protein